MCLNNVQVLDSVCACLAPFSVLASESGGDLRSGLNAVGSGALRVVFLVSHSCSRFVECLAGLLKQGRNGLA